MYMLNDLLNASLMCACLQFSTTSRLKRHRGVRLDPAAQLEMRGIALTLKLNRKSRREVWIGARERSAPSSRIIEPLSGYWSQNGSLSFTTSALIIRNPRRSLIDLRLRSGTQGTLKIFPHWSERLEHLKPSGRDAGASAGSTCEPSGNRFAFPCLYTSAVSEQVYQQWWAWLIESWLIFFFFFYGFGRLDAF